MEGDGVVFFFSDRADATQRLRGTEAQRTAKPFFGYGNPSTLRPRSGQATTARETENGLEDGLGKSEPLDVL